MTSDFLGRCDGLRHQQFDEGDPNPGGLRYDKFCRWPMDDMGVWEYMLRMNQQRVRKYKRGPDDKVFTFSHFLPRAELPAPWGVTEMAKNVGCKELDLQVRMGLGEGLWAALKGRAARARRLFPKLTW